MTKKRLGIYTVIDELENYLLTFRDNEFKVRGVFVYNSTEFLMFKYGPNYDYKKDENIKSVN